MPFHQPSRQFGNACCDITCIIEVFPITSATLKNFFSGPLNVNRKFAPQEDIGTPQTFSISTEVRDIRLFLIDPTLGVQLPIAVLSIANSSLTMSKFAIDTVTNGLLERQPQPADVQITLRNRLWVDYFKLGLTRSWEPLIEPCEFQILSETSHKRGQGYSIYSDCPLHFNLTGALLTYLSETIDSFRNVIRETFGEKNESTSMRRHSIMASSNSQSRVLVKDVTKSVDGNKIEVIHEIPKTLKGEDRVAFSLCNLTGQRLRIHQQAKLSNEDGTDKPILVTYLNQGEYTPLTFDATISVVKNMRLVEVPYPGFPNSKNKTNQQEGSLHHAIDLQ